ncbi:MAG: sarcosine oxidase subunit gamma [Paracoccaceae bacterium]
MSEPVLALKDAICSDGLVEIREVGPYGMITLRGDLASVKIKAAVSTVTGVDMPRQGEANCAGANGLFWMSPDEILVMCLRDEVAANLDKIRKSLHQDHALVENVSDARAVFHVTGPLARDVLAKLAPVDLSPECFQPGQLRRTRLAQVAAAFHMREDHCFEVICFRSVAQYVFDVLKTAARPGSAVQYFDQK